MDATLLEIQCAFQKIMRIHTMLRENSLFVCFLNPFLKARNVRGEYLFIVNDAKYTQSVEIEQCEEEGEPCRTDSDAPFSGQTVCRQKYATYKLYAISGMGRKFLNPIGAQEMPVSFRSFVRPFVQFKLF